MSCNSRIAIGLAALLACTGAGKAAEFGRPATAEEIKAWNIDVSPDGTGLPNGRGDVAHGRQVFEDNCSACHGAKGEGGFADRLVGGRGSLATDHPVKTVGSFWPYATTLFDYVRRAMPYPAPQTLSDDDTYAVVAYILHLNDIVPADAVLDRSNLPTVKMPNRDGFVPDREFLVITNSRQHQGRKP